MAKARGIIKIKGSLYDLTFYKLEGEEVVREKSGVSKERIQREPAFARTRENNQEFSSCARAGRMMREALGPLLFSSKDSRLASRLLQTLCKIKILDQASLRGKRTVARGIAGIAGKQLLTGFDFNKDAPLGSILKAPYVLDEGEGTVVISNFLPGRDLASPKGATHVRLQLATLGLNFETGARTLVLSLPQNRLLTQSSATVELGVEPVPDVAGVNFFLLSLSFYQEVNGIQYSLKNGYYSALQIIGVY